MDWPASGNCNIAETVSNKDSSCHSQTEDDVIVRRDESDMNAGRLIQVNAGLRTRVAPSVTCTDIDVLIHAPVSGETKVLVICPKDRDSIIPTLRDVVAFHPAGLCGCVEVIHTADDTLPTVAAVETVLRERKLPRRWSVVLCFGYDTHTTGKLGEYTKEWLNGICDLIRSCELQGRGEMLLQLSRGDHEKLTHVAERYDVLGLSSGIRVVSLNSANGNQLIDAKRAAGRCLALARILERIPGNVYGELIAYLHVKANGMYQKPPFMKEIVDEESGNVYGLILPDGPKDEESWWSMMAE